MKTIEEMRAYKAKWAREKLVKDPEYREKMRLLSAETNKKLRKDKIYTNPPNICGLKFGKLLVLEKIESDNNNTKWLCLCECGKKIEVYRNYLKSQTTKSCGCSSLRGRQNKTHGDSQRTKEYRCWSGIKSRCLNKKCSSYPNYGGRGILMCERWQHSYENFLADVGRAPSNHHTLDRFPNNNGNYEPSNFRWATRKQQANNKRNNIKKT